MLQVAAAYWLGRPELAMEQVQLQFVVPVWRLHPSKIFRSILWATFIAFLISKIVCGFLTVLDVFRVAWSRVRETRLRAAYMGLITIRFDFTENKPIRKVPCDKNQRTECESRRMRNRVRAIRNLGQRRNNSGKVCHLSLHQARLPLGRRARSPARNPPTISSNDGPILRSSGSCCVSGMLF